MDHQLRAEYLAAIEFYDEDFPWRYTPAAPDTGRHRLRPWLALVVLAEDEFVDVAPTAERPLAAIKVANAALFPPADELWAWAHVHVMRSLVPGSVIPPNLDATLSALSATLNENADLACSRLLSPRRLAPDTAYHAFLVPAFERGRLAGLADDPDLSASCHRQRVGRVRRPAGPATRIRATIDGFSAPAPSATSSISYGCYSRGPSMRGSARVTSTCWIPARICRRSTIPRSPAC